MGGFPGEGDTRSSDTLRGAVAIVLTGVVLGLLQNALAHRSRPPSGLAWIKKEVALPQLEAPAPADGGPGAEQPPPSGYGEMSDPLGLREADAGLPDIPDLGRPIQAQLSVVKKFFDARAAVIVDARPRDEYEAGHIPGALCLPYEEAGFDPEALERFDPGGKPVIVYCGGGACELSTNLALRLVEAGKKRVLVFMGGWTSWEAAGYPVERGPEAAGQS